MKISSERLALTQELYALTIDYWHDVDTNWGRDAPGYFAPDGIFIGPADLSASLGYPGQARHPAVNRAIDDAIRRIRACGKAPGILMVDEPRARECLELGAQFVAVALDTVLLRDGLDGAAARFRGRPETGKPAFAGSY